MPQKKIPNASILGIFSKKADKCEQVLFLWNKPVAEHYKLPNVYWYPKEGQNGVAAAIWPFQNIKHWMAIGSDVDIAAIFSSILKGLPVVIGKNQVLFSVPDHTVHKQNQTTLYLDDDAQELHVKGTDPVSMVPGYFKDTTVLEILCGYRIAPADSADQIFSIGIPGLYAKDEIAQFLKQGTVGVQYRRTPFIGFSSSALPDNSEGSNKMEGFAQVVSSIMAPYQLSLHTSGGEQVGTGLVDPNTGLFGIDYLGELDSGYLQVTDPVSGPFKRHFALVKKLGIFADIVRGQLRDHYGENINVSEKTSTPPERYTPLTWQSDTYGPASYPGKALSDQMLHTLGYLGKNVLIADPYFMGVVKINENGSGKQVMVKEDQVAFLNAAFTAYHLYGLQKIIMLGTSKVKDVQATAGNDVMEVEDSEQVQQNILRTKEPAKLTFEQIIENYKTLLSIQDRGRRIPVFEFKAAPVKLHNRYWFGLILENVGWRIERCVIVSTSLGNMEEVDFIEVTDAGQLATIIARYSFMLQNANDI